MDTEIDKFLSENGFERDTSRSELGNIITSPHTKEIMGYEQMDIRVCKINCVYLHRLFDTPIFRTKKCFRQYCE